VQQRITAHLVSDARAEPSESIFGDDLFADPAWDMLLELHAAELGQRRMATSELCIGAAVPATTALRWVEKLNQKGLVARRNDPLDGRRVWVELSPHGASLMRRYFEECPVEI
jgi:DNA-binding MarR family transcriptional regulator